MNNLDRFKFRFFDKILGFMAEVIHLNAGDGYAIVRFSYADEYTPDEEVNISRGILMQSTGLRDKNGKLIFEGDVVKCDSTYKCPHEVIWNNDYWYLSGIRTSSVFGRYEWSGGEEIIGNIYENPDLLKHE